MPTESLPERDTAKDLWSNGLSAPEISIKLGVKVATIHKWIARYRWKRKNAIVKVSDTNAQPIDSQDAIARFTSLAIEQSERLMGVIRDNKVRTLGDAKTAASALAAASATGRKWLGLDNESRVSSHLHVHVMKGAAPRVASSTDMDVIDVQCVDESPATTPTTTPGS